MAGLPWSAWLLLAVAVGLGLVVEWRFLARHKSGSPTGDRNRGHL